MGNRRKIAGLIGLLALLAGQGPAFAACAPDTLDLAGEGVAARFTVEIADTPAERAQGLMFRESMPKSAGMLFIYEQPQHASFWMKNTLIPLDMIFADEAGVVTQVHSNAVPGDLTGVDGGPGVKYVLEINGGLARRMGIAPGVTMRHAEMDQETAARPCESGD